MFDTHAIARSLTDADLTPAQADAITDAIRQCSRARRPRHVRAVQDRSGRIAGRHLPGDAHPDRRHRRPARPPSRVPALARVAPLTRPPNPRRAGGVGRQQGFRAAGSILPQGIGRARRRVVEAAGDRSRRRRNSPPLPRCEWPGPARRVQSRKTGPEARRVPKRARPPRAAGLKKNSPRPKPGAVVCTLQCVWSVRPCYARRRSHAPRPASRRPRMPMPTSGSAGASFMSSSSSSSVIVPPGINAI